MKNHTLINIEKLLKEKFSGKKLIGIGHLGNCTSDSTYSRKMAIGKIIKDACLSENEDGFPGIFLFFGGDFDDDYVDGIFIYSNEDVLIS